ncbi:MAG: bifunctional oligoribonuclease/PAP phosphatase NrnA [Desulfobacterales bacterium]
MRKILQKIESARRLLVTAHAEPDGDAVGSMLGLGLALERTGREVCFYNESPIPAVYRFLPGVERIRRDLENAPAPEAAVLLDCAGLDRVGGAAERIARVPCVINIDHHASNTGFGTVCLIDETACATAEIVFRLIGALGIEPDRRIATCLYTGILTDTGSFRFSNTNEAAFAISLELVRRGVNPYEVAQHVYGSYSLGRIKLLNLALDSIEISPNGKLSMMTVTRAMLDETRTQPEDADGLINYARRIKDVRVAALIQEQQPNGGDGGRPRLHVSLRSDGSVDVAEYASAFGGGGHRRAAGFYADEGLAEIKARLLAWAGRLG